MFWITWPLNLGTGYTRLVNDQQSGLLAYVIHSQTDQAISRRFSCGHGSRHCSELHWFSPPNLVHVPTDHFEIWFADSPLHVQDADGRHRPTWRSFIGWLHQTQIRHPLWNNWNWGIRRPDWLALGLQTNRWVNQAASLYFSAMSSTAPPNFICLHFELTNALLVFPVWRGARFYLRCLALTRPCSRTSFSHLRTTTTFINNNYSASKRVSLSQNSIISSDRRTCQPMLRSLW